MDTKGLIDNISWYAGQQWSVPFPRKRGWLRTQLTAVLLWLVLLLLKLARRIVRR